MFFILLFFNIFFIYSLNCYSKLVQRIIFKNQAFFKIILKKIKNAF